jgi:hypothetical protein
MTDRFLAALIALARRDAQRGSEGVRAWLAEVER